MTKFIYSKGIINQQTCQENTNTLFIFGDNLIKQGCGGQAIIRYEPNSFGIPTKRLPSMTPDSFFSDQEDEEKAIIESLQELLEIKDNYDFVAFPEMGLGTGLADMENKSPFLFNKLKKIIEKLVSES